MNGPLPWCRTESAGASGGDIWGQKKLGDGDLNRLDQRVAGPVIDEDLVVGRDHPKPVLALGEGIRAGALGQRDPVGQGQRVAIQADDKHRDHQYEARNHHNRQHCHQPFEVGQMRREAFRIVIHVCDHCYILHRGQSATAS